MIEVQFSNKFSDALEWVISGTVLGGAADTFFGQFDAHDRIFLRLAYSLQPG